MKKKVFIVSLLTLVMILMNLNTVSAASIRDFNDEIPDEVTQILDHMHVSAMADDPLSIRTILSEKFDESNQGYSSGESLWEDGSPLYWETVRIGDVTYNHARSSAEENYSIGIASTNLTATYSYSISIKEGECREYGSIQYLDGSIKRLEPMF